MLSADEVVRFLEAIPGRKSRIALTTVSAAGLRVSEAVMLKRVSLRAAAAPLSTILQPIALDPLTVADDPNFLSEIANQPNVLNSVRTGLVLLY